MGPRAFPTVLAAIALWAAPASPAGATEDAALRQQVDSAIARSGAEVAVAYRTLDGRNELFLRADDRFHAASTMKVPVMIELFRQSAAGRFGLDDQVPVVNEFRSIVDGSRYSLSPDDDSESDLYRLLGATRSWRTLCEAMITVSSNLATNILIDRLGVESIRATVTALGAGGMDVRRGVEDEQAFQAGLNNTTTARGLLVLLEAVATGRAVSPEASREMVEILKRQRFNDAIPAGLPAGTAVAHKTGTITAIHHDAAIVYAPRPYVLVILVRGIPDEKVSSTLMAEITRIVDVGTRQ